MDREEFYRLKKVQAKKKRDQAEEDAKAALQKASQGGDRSGGTELAAADLLADKDPDVIF